MFKSVSSSPSVAVGSHPHCLFAAKETTTLKMGSSTLTLNKFSNFIAINGLTALQGSRLSTIPGLRRLPDDLGHSIFKLTDPTQVAAVVTSGVMPEQITTPLYVSERLRIPNGMIYIWFKKDTTDSMIDAIIKEHQLIIVKTMGDADSDDTESDDEIAYVVKSSVPLKDSVQIAFILQQNPSISVAEPDLISGLTTCADALTI